MNALGKLLTVFVFLGSLVWLGFTAALFAARSDWKAVAMKAQTDAKEAQAKAEELTKQVLEERKVNDARLASSEQVQITLRKERDAARDDYAKLKNSADATADQTAKLQPTINELQSVNTTLQSQADALTKQVSTISTDRDKAVLLQQAAENRANDSALRLGVSEKAREDQMEKTRALLEARQGTAEADADFRGDVIEVGTGKAQNIIQFTGGANAGVKAGNRYVVKRDVAPFFVGTVVVLDASHPQYSSGVFTPAAGQKLAGDYLPRKGDTVSAN
ncbi:MAG: hypothetical protein MUF18_09355 [Fimbriiglobus sp.]|jgi:hypothetical protein|nr:hypothetical protein [Fimbriiglobus sp.]